MKPWKLLAALAAVVGAGVAVAQLPTGQTYWTETQAGTRAAPDGGCGCSITPAGNLGFCLNLVQSVHPTVQCSDGSNITAGAIDGWFCSPKLNAWAPAPTYTNVTLPTGGPIAIGPEFSVANPFGRMLWASVGVTCSGGSWDGGVSVAAEQAQQ